VWLKSPGYLLVSPYGNDLSILYGKSLRFMEGAVDRIDPPMKQDQVCPLFGMTG
jgi:hypothetical protein